MTIYSQETGAQFLDTFTETPHCAKCGGNETYVVLTYHLRPESSIWPCWPHIEGEHLCMTCRRCHFKWCMETYDG